MADRQLVKSSRRVATTLPYQGARAGHFLRGRTMLRPYNRACILPSRGDKASLEAAPWYRSRRPTERWWISATTASRSSRDRVRMTPPDRTYISGIGAAVIVTNEDTAA